MAEKGWHPLLGILVAWVLAVPFLVWYDDAGGWAPSLVYALAAAAGALWLRGQDAPRTMAAYLVSAALAIAFLMPIAWLPVAPPTE